MRRAVQLAALGEGWVEPNPMVGCVVVKAGRIVGEGFHQRFGGPHAEVLALQQAGEAARGATLYVTLEPCCHHGKTPPCTRAIIAAGIQRVVAACQDPYPEVRGRGFEQLRQAGIQVDVGLAAQEAEQLLAPYLTRLRFGRPWVIAKYAMTWDGKIATTTGESRWISGAQSRARVHQLRGRVDAIAVGRGTALRDDPLLLAQPPGPRTATRIVFDSYARLPLSSRLVRTVSQAPVLVVACQQTPRAAVEALRAAGCQVWLGSPDAQERLRQFLAFLAQSGTTNLLVEGGGGLLGTFFDTQLIDEVHVFLSPKLIGGENAPAPIGGKGIAEISKHCRLVVRHVEPLGEDWYGVARAVRNAQGCYISELDRDGSTVMEGT